MMTLTGKAAKNLSFISFPPLQHTLARAVLSVNNGSLICLFAYAYPVQIRKEGAHRKTRFS